MRGFSDHKASVLVLIAANMVPLFGVIFLGWDAFAIIVLYWVENVIIGAINVLKMITCNPSVDEVDFSTLSAEQGNKLRQAMVEHAGEMKIAQWLHHGAKVFMVPFFIFHYGMFCFVHGIFVLALFGHHDFDMSLTGEARAFSGVLSHEHLWWAVAGLAGSHLFSYFANFLAHGEYRRVQVNQLMSQPYARVVVLHLAILFGAWVSLALGSNVGVLAILIVGKTALDLKLHLREHEKNDSSEPKSMARQMLDDLERREKRSNKLKKASVQKTRTKL